MTDKIQNVYIIGSKGIPARYGGFETFVEKLTENKINRNLRYHVACTLENSKKSNNLSAFYRYNNAECFVINVPNIGSAKAIYYDLVAIKKAIWLAKKNNDVEPIFYILACRIGPFIKRIHKEIISLGGKLYINPDGHEWKRAKWSYPVRKYWKISEKLMVKHSDRIICDSKNIEQYISTSYSKYRPKTCYLAYGTDLSPSNYNKKSMKVREWFDNKKITENDYYLIVGRFVPENNYETMIREFLISSTSKSLVIVSNVAHSKFYEKLVRKTNFERNPRIKFVGTVYNNDLLKYIRENAYAYIHGHEVGGTNPSLLEALSSTKINLLYDIGFNREVGQNSALYWNKSKKNLSNLIDKLENSSDEKITFEHSANSLMRDNFSWELIVEKYENIFINGDFDD